MPRVALRGYNYTKKKNMFEKLLIENMKIYSNNISFLRINSSLSIVFVQRL